MRVIFLIILGLSLIGCSSKYGNISPKGERLISNTIVGCAVGEVLFGACAEGAAVAGGATIIDDQTD